MGWGDGDIQVSRRRRRRSSEAPRSSPRLPEAPGGCPRLPQTVVNAGFSTKKQCFGSFFGTLGDFPRGRFIPRSIQFFDAKICNPSQPICTFSRKNLKNHQVFWRFLVKFCKKHNNSQPKSSIRPMAGFPHDPFIPRLEMTKIPHDPFIPRLEMPKIPHNPFIPKC